MVSLEVLFLLVFFCFSPKWTSKIYVYADYLAIAYKFGYSDYDGTMFVDDINDEKSIIHVWGFGLILLKQMQHFYASSIL